MYTASVAMPVVVRIGGAPLRARAWYARKMYPNESMRNSFSLATAPSVTRASGLHAALRP